MEPISATRIKGLYTYLESLDWSEPWLYLLIGLHLSILTVIWATRKAGMVQSIIFFMLLAVVYLSEPLNEHLAQNHKWFTEHQYFDSSGLFISVVLSLPLLLLCCFIVCLWFYETVVLLGNLRSKRLERQSNRSRAAQTPEDENQETLASQEQEETGGRSKAIRRRRTRREN